MCIKQYLKSFWIIVMIGSCNFATAQNHNKAQLANEYFQKKDYDKAIDIYKSLAGNKKNTSLIHTNYIDALFVKEDYKDLKKYLQSAIKMHPRTVTYLIDLGVFYHRTGDAKQGDKIFNNALQKNAGNQFQLQKAAEHFEIKNRSDFSIRAYKNARLVSLNPRSYALELANIYRHNDREEEMLEEYFNFASISDKNLVYVKNSLQNMYREPKAQNELEFMLIDKIQEEPDKTLYAELLIWLNLQQKNFKSAFTQAKAYEKRTGGRGQKLFHIAAIAFENKAYDDAINIYTYIIEKFKTNNEQVTAKRSLLSAREEKVKSTYPVELTEVSRLVNQYDEFIKQAGRRPERYYAMRKKALLQAFYLDQRSSSIEVLESITRAPGVHRKLKSQVLIDLGDIYLLDGQPWESTLLYSQAEKSESESDLGHQAKLKNAKLNYYEGNFVLAQSRLDILKAATSREIANDALDLSALIRNNTILDTSTTAMEKFAKIDLLLFQNRKSEALSEYKKLNEEFPFHSLTDDIWWRIGNMYTDLGQTDSAAIYFEKIQGAYDDDVYGDDSYFELGKIHELKGNTDKAQEIYKDLIIRYPGTIFIDEARDRYRKLRGDLLTQ